MLFAVLELVLVVDDSSSDGASEIARAADGRAAIQEATNEYAKIVIHCTLVA